MSTNRKLHGKGPITIATTKRINKEWESSDQNRVKLLSNWTILPT